MSNIKNPINRKQKRSRKRKLILGMKKLAWEQGTQLRLASLHIRSRESIRPLLKTEDEITCVNVLYYSVSVVTWFQDFSAVHFCIAYFSLLELISLAFLSFFFFLERCLLHCKSTCLHIYLYDFIEI